MTESAAGLILRVRPLTETSLIIHWLTPELGRIATVAKGARRPKSTFAGRLDLFYSADFSFSRSRSSSLHNLREVKLRETHGAIRADMTKLQQAGYAAAFIEQATETDTPLPEVFGRTENITAKYLYTGAQVTARAWFDTRFDGDATDLGRKKNCRSFARTGLAKLSPAAIKPGTKWRN